LPADALLILAGPTGVGKSELALALAARVPAEIVVADSMQVYRGLDIGTGKPTAAERARISHHLLDICDPTEGFSAFEFAARAKEAVAAIRARGKLPILVGGTGLYLRAFLKGGLPSGGRDAELRARLAAEAEAEGTVALHARLAERDPASAARIRPQDRFRIVRALELMAVTGRPASALRPDLWETPSPTGVRFVVVTRERAALYARIDARCVAMWRAGLVAEVRGLLAAGHAPDLRPLQALGYRQAVAVALGRLSPEAGLEEMQRATRQYARRQLTWFRREPAAEWIRIDEGAGMEPALGAILARLDPPCPNTEGEGV
jgi:tRNA dimethylallyltransferase